MRRHQPPEPQPLAVIIAELVARAERGPPPAWKPDGAAPVRRYRPPRYIRHPGQLPFRFPEEAPGGIERSRLQQAPDSVRGSTAQDIEVGPCPNHSPPQQDAC